MVAVDHLYLSAVPVDPAARTEDHALHGPILVGSKQPERAWSGGQAGIVGLRLRRDIGNREPANQERERESLRRPMSYVIQCRITYIM